MKTKTTRTALGITLVLAVLLGVALGLGRGVAYAANGDLDTTFGGGDGLVNTNFIDTEDEARAVAIQSDGKIVAVGSTHITGTNYNFSVARYNPDGSPDNTFGGGLGKLTTDFSGRDDRAYGVAIQPDDKIVVVGSTGPWYENGAYCFAAVRYQPNGDLDTSFSLSGRFYLGFRGDYCGEYPGSAVALGVAIQSDGNMVLAGYTTHESSPNFGLMRLNTNGALDSGFDGDGKLTTDFFGGADGANGVAIQPDGKIVAAGNAQVNGSDYDFALARYNSNGSLDSSFSGDGKATTDFFGGGDDGAYALAIQPDGNIVVAGHSWNVSGGYDFGFARYLSNGDLDTTFDVDGKQAVGFVDGVNEEVALGLALQTDGKIVAAGYAPIDGINDFALTRLAPDGSLDYEFGGGDGRVNNDFGGGVAIANSLAIQADGRIVAAGTAYMGEPHSYDYALARYLSGLEPPPPPTETPGGPTATATPQASPTACPVQFPDVQPGSTFYEFVRCLACRGIVSGFPDGSFRPNSPVTRGQLSKIVSNSAGYIENHTNQSFEDVPVGSTFHLFIERLFSRGYISGYPCGGVGEPCVTPGNRPYFRPSANVTRGQTSKIVASARGLPAPTPGQQSFEDVAEGSTFWEWIEALASSGAISGYACGNPEPCVPPLNRPYFRPNSNVTRGQSAKIVANTFFPGCQTP